MQARSIRRGDTEGVRPESGEKGSLETGHPPHEGRASKGRGRSEECRVVRRELHGPAGNRANPRTGCGVQQTREAQCEEAAEVVRNDEGGTCSGVASPNLGKPRVDARSDVGGGAVFEELQERNPRPSVGFGRQEGEGSERNGRPSKRRRRIRVSAARREERKLLCIGTGREETPDAGRANHPRTPDPRSVQTRRHFEPKPTPRKVPIRTRAAVSERL